MVRPLVILAAAFCFVATATGLASQIPAYALGDVATNDVIITSRLVVVDDEATEEIRQREAQKIDPFVVFSTNHAALIEGEIRLAVTRVREAFRAELQTHYGSTTLLPEVTESESFQELASQFLDTSPGPPVPLRVLPLWAQGRDTEGFLRIWLPPLRETLKAPICPDEVLTRMRAEDHHPLRIVRVDDLNQFVKEPFALSNSQPGSVEDFMPLSQARDNLRALLPQQRKPLARYLEKQLQANCRVDSNLTQRVRQFAVSGLVQMKQFEAGEAVIRKGQVIDEKALAILMEIRERARVSQLERQVAVDQVSVQLLSERNIGLAGLLGITALLLLWVLIRAHRRRRQELVPVLSSTLVHHGAEEEALAASTVVEVPSAEHNAWEQRALEAEQRAERAHALARSALMPHLAQHLKDSVLQQLNAQMDDMLDVQAAVAEQLTSMEERLERLHAPLQERLRLYEQRISELETELAQRGQENQLLLRARIEALRWQMEQERSGAQVN
jgi:membrane-associated HD superfamily phosphohydrolase